MSTDSGELPVVAWRTIVRERLGMCPIYHYAEIPPEGDDLTVEWQTFADHAAATAIIEGLRAELAETQQKYSAACDVICDLGGELREPEFEAARMRTKNAARYRLWRAAYAEEACGRDDLDLMLKLAYAWTEQQIDDAIDAHLAALGSAGQC